jgi:CheY-like chemotaxis protein
VKPVSGEHLLAAVTRLLPPPRADEQSPRLRVVVVDDDPLALKLVRSTHEPLGWEVHTCAGGQQAADLVRAVEPSVVVIDLLMPHVDGFAALELIRDHEPTAHIPVVALTAFAMHRDRERALVSGFAGYLEKPISVREFPAQVRRHLPRREARDP